MKVQLNIQSISDVITNSSTEIFCQIQPSTYEVAKEIKAFLSGLSRRKIEIEDNAYEYDDNDEPINPHPVINFIIEYGDYDYLTKDFATLLDVALSSVFPKESYTIDTNVDW